MILIDLVTEKPLRLAAHQEAFALDTGGTSYRMSPADVAGIAIDGPVKSYPRAKLAKVLGGHYCRELREHEHDTPEHQSLIFVKVGREFHAVAKSDPTGFKLWTLKRAARRAEERYEKALKASKRQRPGY